MEETKDSITERKREESNEKKTSEGTTSTTSTTTTTTATTTAAAEEEEEEEEEDLCSCSSVREMNKKRSSIDSPPTDDCCPICFGSFAVACRASCGHWYCGGCILQYWNYGAAFQPCKCPMCFRQITWLRPEASLNHQQEVEVTDVLKNIQKYNRLFVGGMYGLFLDPKNKRRQTPKANTPRDVAKGIKGGGHPKPSNIGDLFSEGSLNPYTDDPYAFD